MAAVAFWVVVNTWLASLQFFFLLWLLSFPVGAKNNTNGNKISPHYQLLLYNEAIIYSKVLTQENNFSKGAHIPSFKIFSWFAAKPNTWSTKVPKCRWKYSNGSVIWVFKNDLCGYFSFLPQYGLSLAALVTQNMAFILFYLYTFCVCACDVALLFLWKDPDDDATAAHSHVVNTPPPNSYTTLQVSTLNWRIQLALHQSLKTILLLPSLQTFSVTTQFYSLSAKTQ